MTIGPKAKLSAFAALWAAIRGQRRPGAPGLGALLGALPRLISGVLKGTYTGMGRSRLLWMAAALVYIVSPVDLIPEGMFMILGLGDDALVMTWLAGTILSETEAFLDWEAAPDHVAGGHDTYRDQAKGPVIPGEVL